MLDEYGNNWWDRNGHRVGIAIIATLCAAVAGVIVLWSVAIWRDAHRRPFAEEARPMTRADIECVPPRTIIVQHGYYSTPPYLSEVIDWCDFREEFEPSVNFSGSTVTFPPN